MGPGEVSSILGRMPHCWLQIYEIHGKHHNKWLKTEGPKADEL